MRIHRNSVDRAKNAYSETVIKREKKPVTIDEHRKIESFISNPSIPGSLSNSPTFPFKINDIDMQFIKNGDLDKDNKLFGVIINSLQAEKSVNLSPVLFLETGEKNAFYVENKEKNVIGFFTPFHTVLFNPDTMKFSRSLEDGENDPTEEMAVTCYTRDNKIVDTITLKVIEPFLDPCQFVETYYPDDFLDFMEQKR
jgi:hypothetical protein